MNCKQAKEIDMVDFLAQNGFFPARPPIGDEFWYLSPLRDEKTPSFKVDRERKIWIDFGDGARGSIIDLGMRLFGCDITTLLEKLSGQYPHLSTQPPAPRPPIIERTPKITIMTDGPLFSYPLKNYLRQRCIPLPIGERYLREVHFQIKEQSYYSLGFKNRSGGFELRNKFFKGSSSPKDITLLGTNKDHLMVFEGFFNFLSCVAHLEALEKPIPTALILNSTAFIGRSLPLLAEYGRLTLYLDNDPSGKAATETIQTALKGVAPIRDEALLYHKYGDYNMWWQHSWVARRLRQFDGRRWIKPGIDRQGSAPPVRRCAKRHHGLAR